jgi:ABC-2 type transport system ATP-binding protein
MQLTINNLGKQYKRDFWGLRNFSLDIKPGILGLLGPNGAGKSTFMRMLATITCAMCLGISHRILASIQI